MTGGEDPANLGKIDPTLQELVDGFKYWIEYTLIPTIQKFGKKAFVTESGYCSFDGVNRNPIGVIGPKPYVVDWKEQADCYNVLLDYFIRNDLLEALTFWPGWIYNDANVAIYHGSWDNLFSQAPVLGILDWIYGKPAERIIQANWKR